MSYPVQRCPYCQREIPESDVDRAIQKEMELWRPYDCDLPEYYTWTAGRIDSGSTTVAYNPVIPYTFTVT